jgi:hypothetical protein
MASKQTRPPSAEIACASGKSALMPNNVSALAVASKMVLWVAETATFPFMVLVAATSPAASCTITEWPFTRF